jgi:hypothetical protein
VARLHELGQLGPESCTKVVNAKAALFVAECQLLYTHFFSAVLSDAVLSRRCCEALSEMRHVSAMRYTLCPAGACSARGAVQQQQQQQQQQRTGSRHSDKAGQAWHTRSDLQGRWVCSVAAPAHEASIVTAQDRLSLQYCGASLPMLLSDVQVPRACVTRLC